MGNVSSSDHEKVNELLMQRAKKKISERNRKQQQGQQQQQQQQHAHPQLHIHQHQHHRAVPVNGYGVHTLDQPTGLSMNRQKSSTRYGTQDPLEYYANSSGNSGNRMADFTPNSPSSPSFSSPSSATTPTSASYQSDAPAYLSSRFSHDDRDEVLPRGEQTGSRSLQYQSTYSQQFSNIGPPVMGQGRSSPIVIPQQKQQWHSYGIDSNAAASTSSSTTAPITGVNPKGTASIETHDGKSPSSPSTFVPLRRGSEHQQQLFADPALLGTSPEAKDWLRQKPMRSSSHMIHQYNFHNHQYYQLPGTTVKVVNNTCRNMTGYPSNPAMSPSGSTTTSATSTALTSSSTIPPTLGARSLSAGAHSGPMPDSRGGASHTSSTSAVLNGSASSSNTGVEWKRSSLDSESSNSNGPSSRQQLFASAPIPGVRTRGLSQPEQSSATGIRKTADSHYGHVVHLAAPPQHSIPKEPPVGKLVMSRSKINTPLTVLSSPPGASSTATFPSRASRPPSGSPPSGSRLEQQQSSQHEDTSGPAVISGAGTSVPRHHRPSSTLSSLRSLLGNHPQGLSLIDSLEEDEDDDLDSLSDSETGDSDSDLVQRTQLLSTTDAAGDDLEIVSTLPEKRGPRRRPPPNLEWMAERRRFSTLSLSTISIDVQDSQKGQHALWKYIGGGNSHAPLRYDISRILDSGCGLGEWTMEMAREFPNATVYGIDINPELFPSAQQPVPSNCLFTQSNLLTRLSFPDQYFDFVFQRFLYLGLTVDDWPVALKELKRVMKPGGWIELFEPCMRVHRAGARTREVMRWCSRLLQEERGLDFDFAGENMKRLCESEEIGFQNVRIERLSIPVGRWGGRVGQAMAENMVLIFQNLQSALLMDETGNSRGDGPHKAFDGMVQSWIRECEENESYIDYYILVAQRAPL